MRTLSRMLQMMQTRVITSRVCGGSNVFVLSLCVSVCVSVCVCVGLGYNF